MAKSRKKLNKTKAPEIYLPTIIDRYRGSLVGLAVGDALATNSQGVKPRRFKPNSDIVGVGPFRLKAGEWTTQTSMALWLAGSLIVKGTSNPADQMQCYLRWFKYGHMSVNGRSIGDPYSGGIHPTFVGNGSIMRLAPVPLFYAANPAEAIEKSGLSSRITPQAPAAIDACRYLGALIVGAVSGAGKEELLGERYSPVVGYWQENPLVTEIDEVASGSFKHLDPPKIRGRSYVARSLEAALWAFHRSNSFQEGCRRRSTWARMTTPPGLFTGKLQGPFTATAAFQQGGERKSRCVN